MLLGCKPLFISMHGLCCPSTCHASFALKDATVFVETISLGRLFQ